MSKEDGGPAFPTSIRKDENYMDAGGYGRSRTVTVQEGGMSLRDWFAATIDIPWAHAREVAQTQLYRAPSIEEVINARVQLRFKEADMMLEERSK